MSTPNLVAYATTLEVRDACLCLHTQRAARALARHFDGVFRHLGITNGQFSLMMALNRSQPPRIGDVASLLAMDRTTLTALLKTLERRKLVTVVADKDDARAKRLGLTRSGQALLAKAAPLWRSEHAALEQRLTPINAEQLRTGLNDIAFKACAVD